MLCPNCNHKNDDRRRYCEKCGEYLYQEDAPMETTQIHKVETVVKTDKKKIFHLVLIGMICTLVVVGGSSIYFMNDMRTQKDAEINELKKEKKALNKEIKKLKKTQNSNESSYDKQLSELNEENKKQAQEIASLEKKNAKLQKQVDESNTNTDSDTDTDTETKKDADKSE